MLEFSLQAVRSPDSSNPKSKSRSARHPLQPEPTPAASVTDRTAVGLGGEVRASGGPRQSGAAIVVVFARDASNDIPWTRDYMYPRG